MAFCVIFCQECGSLLARFFAHFQHPGTLKNYVVMNNFMPPLTDLKRAWPQFSEQEQEDALFELAQSTHSYDLKVGESVAFLIVRRILFTK
jgi:hypothetical protein